MNGNDLISFFQNGLDAISKVNPIVCAIFTAIYFRKNTSTAEFEKLKAAKFQEVVDKLLDSGDMTYTEFYKANNFLHIAELADERLKHDFQNKVEENQKYDFDWFMRFYDIVGNVSNEAMQSLWAGILAGEIHQNGTYSLQLLDILKNFTQKQAGLFNKVCSHCFIIENNVFIPNDEDYLKYANITYQDILDLDSLGLMYSSGIISWGINMEPNQQFAINNDKLRMVVKYNGQESTTQKFTFHQFPFTMAGRELGTLIGTHGSDEDFLFFIKLISKNNSYGIPFNITAERIIVKDNSTQFEKIDLESDASTIDA